MVPVSQSILAASFPPAKRGQAFALFGVAVVVAPVVGPALGGWLADNYSWRWCFLINGPVGLATIALIAVLLPADKPNEEQAARFDVIGFLLVATFLGSLEIVLDRGLEDDWFASSFIVMFTAICALAFVLMIPWEATRRDPMIDVRMVGTRQFGACFLVMGATGAILYATSQFLPLLVQTDFGYTATWAGVLLTPGGLVTMVMMFVVGRSSSRIQPKYLIMTGAIFCAISMYQLTNVYGDLDFWFFARTRMALGVGLPLIFIPIIAASYDGIPANRVDMASALINAARNTGGSIGVSLASNLLNHREQFHQSRLIEHAIPSSQQYQDTLHQVTHYFLAQGSLLARGAAAGDRLDRPAGAGAIVLPRLHGRLLGADAALARGRAAGAEPAQGQARRRGAGGALRAHRSSPVQPLVTTYERTLTIDINLALRQKRQSAGLQDAERFRGSVRSAALSAARLQPQAAGGRKTGPILRGRKRKRKPLNRPPRFVVQHPGLTGGRIQEQTPRERSAIVKRGPRPSDSGRLAFPRHVRAS